MAVIDGRLRIVLNKIMYATDFSPTAEKAGKYAKALALRFGSAVQIVHIIPSYSEGLAEPVPGEREARKRHLVLQEDEFRAAGIKTYCSLTSEWPVPDALLIKERESEANLIVAGTESKSTLDRFLLGSTAEHLIRNALCPVLTVGPGAREPKAVPLALETILFAADFSDASNRASGFALAFAQDAGAHLWIGHIASSKDGDPKLPKTLAEKKFRENLERLIPSEAFDWCSLECTAEQKNPAQGILDIANRTHADLIVMGARARSFWLEHISRGVTQDVLAKANCPVLTVH